jgi:hypothetical protein
MVQFLKYMVFFGKVHVFLQLSCIGLFATKRALHHIENYDLQGAFLPKLTHSSQGNNALDVAAYNTDGFLWRDTCVSSNQMNNPICNKKCVYPPGNTKVGGSIPFKN